MNDSLGSESSQTYGQPMSRGLRKRFWILAILFSAIHFLTLPLDLIDIDSSQYAEIVREMSQSGQFTTILDNGRRYLDKPILTFWTILPFFSMFGPENWSFRLPSVLISLLSVWALFGIVWEIWRNERRAWLAALFYLACPGLYAMVLDPKIDVYLNAYLIFTHYFYFLGRNRNPRFYYLMYISIGLGFITKGPISLVIPAISIGLDILFRRDWALLFRMRIPTGFFVMLFFPALWSYFLYRDYSSYGPSFFLWIQSFGRFYKDLYDVKYDPLFFYKNFAWAFLHFFLPLAISSLFLAWSYWKRISFREIIRKIKENDYKDQNFTFAFWLFLFLFLISFSKFQLPQYVYWVLPAGSIIFSGFAERQLFAAEKPRTRFSYLFSGFLFFVFILVLPFFSLDSPFQTYWIPLVALVVLGYILQKIPLELSLPLAGIFGAYLLVGLYLYPLLLRYQPASYFGPKIKEMEPGKEVLYTYRISSSKRSYAFYSDRLFRNIYDKKKFGQILEESGPRLVVIPEAYLENFNDFLGSEFSVEVIDSRESYKVATPKLEFFLSKKRPFITNKIFLVLVKKI